MKVKRVKIVIGVEPEKMDDQFFDWTNRKMDEIGNGIPGNPRMEVEVKDGWTWLVISCTNLPDVC